MDWWEYINQPTFFSLFNSGFDIVFGDLLRVHCTSDQSTHALYNLNEGEYNECTLPVTGENIEIGECRKTKIYPVILSLCICMLHVNTYMI